MAETPDPVSATAKILELFASRLADKGEMQRRLEACSAQQHPTVGNLLRLAWYRNELRFLNPLLPVGTPLTPATLWAYWSNHPEEHQGLQSEQKRIIGYLLGSEGKGNERQMLDLVRTDSVTLRDAAPVVKELYRRKRGRPRDRDRVAVRALQLRWDTNLTWQEIANQSCDCPKKEHEDCAEAIRQAVLVLQRFLKQRGLRWR